MKSTLLLFLLLPALLRAGNDGVIDKSQNSLRIMSYNIKMLPRILKSQHHHPIVRAKILPSHLIEQQADIIVFQEAFDHKADRILKKSMRSIYPYMIGPANNKLSGIKTNSGVMIFSKFPLKQLGAIRYKDCDDYDCLAQKGVLLVEVNDGKHVYQVAGTHLNSSSTFEIKKSQYKQMSEFVKQFARPGVPQFLAGDYNTSNLDPKYYDEMIHTLDAEDGPISGDLQFTNDHKDNDMEYYEPQSRNTIDYILYKPNGIKPNIIARKVLQIRQRWSKKHQDLSDHNALVMDVNWL